jgi:hypothetical protein
VQELSPQETEELLDVSALRLPAERKRPLRLRTVSVEMMESIAVSDELLAQFIPELESILLGLRPCLLRDVDDISFVIISGMNILLRNTFGWYRKDREKMNGNAQPLLQVPQLTHQALRGWERSISTVTALHHRPFIPLDFPPQHVQRSFKIPNERIPFDMFLHIAVLF